MFNFSKRLLVYVFSILFLGMFGSSQKSFSFDYLIIETYYQPKCQVCFKKISAENYYVYKDGEQVKPYIYFSRNDFSDLIMCRDCYEKNRDFEYMSLVMKFYPDFKSSDLQGLSKNQLLINEMPLLRMLRGFNGRYKECVMCKGNIDKFFEKIWYKCSNYPCAHLIHEECANKSIKNNGQKTIVLCPICKKYDLERVDPYMQSSIGEKKAAITQFIRAAYLKEFLK